MLCICAPDTAIAAPARIAVNILGSLSFKITAVSARPVSPIDKSTNPVTIKMLIPMAIMYVNLFLDFMYKNSGNQCAKLESSVNFM